MQNFNIIGGGAWGTALAILAQQAGHATTLWAREPEVVQSVNSEHLNSMFLPNVKLDPAIKATLDIADAAKAEALLLAVPAQFLRLTLQALIPHLDANTPLVICAKGIELTSGALMSEVTKALTPDSPLAVLSGPTFAIEVAKGLPAAVTLACYDNAIGDRLCERLRTPKFRAYKSDDLIGAEIGGSVKNVLAIACGIIEGRGLGNNARAALITRGLMEMARLCIAKGGRPETLMGLSGIGDLMLTCNAMQSRNFSLGVELGHGQGLSNILNKRKSVAEGVDTASAISSLADKIGLDMPICRAVNAIVTGNTSIDEAISQLLARPVGTDSPLDVKSHF